MPIDLTAFFIYNYYGVNSGDIARRKPPQLCAKAKIYIMRGAKT